MPALFDGVMQRAISAGLEQVSRQLPGGNDNRTKRRWGNNHKSTSSDDLSLPEGATHEIRL